MKKKMALLATALVGASMGLVACKTNIGWLDEKICEHKEYKLVEVVDAMCGEEGEKIMECVKCGKKATEKIEKLAHTDEDGDDTCDVCEKQIVELVEAEVGEKVVGNTYRIYHSTEDMSKYGLYISASSEVEYFNCPNGISIWVQDASVSYNPTKSSTDKLPFEIKEVWTKNYTEGYIEFTVEAGEYTLDDIPFEINEDAEITKFIEKGGVYRVVALE